MAVQAYATITEGNAFNRSIGMYVPPGANALELGDIDVIAHEGRIHLFHLTLPQT